MRRLAWLFACLTLLAACAATPPPLPAVHHGAGERIGVLVALPQTPMHTHIGTTVFNNFEKTYPYPWNLAGDLRTAILRELAHAGFEPVDLAAAGFNAAQLQDLVAVRGELAHAVRQPCQHADRGPDARVTAQPGWHHGEQRQTGRPACRPAMQNRGAA